jgi:hypothetical protein
MTFVEIAQDVLVVAGAVSTVATVVGGVLTAFGATKAAAVAKTVGVDVGEFVSAVKGLFGKKVTS